MLNLVAMVADAIMVAQLFRRPASYFRPYRSYFAAIYLLFAVFPFRELVLMTESDDLLLLVSTQLLITGAVIIAFLWGHLVTRLYLHPVEFSVRSLLKPSRNIHYLFILYLAPFAATLAIGLGVPGAVETNPSSSALYLLSQVSYRVVSYSALFLSVAATVVVAFVAYPYAVLTHLRSQLRDPKVRSALRVIAVSFGVISALILGVNAMAGFGLSIEAPGHIVAVALLILVVREFSNASFLESFFGLLPAYQKASVRRARDRRVLLYGGNAEKFGPIARYIEEGVAQAARIILFHQGTEPAIRDWLSKQGIDYRQLITKGDLRLIATDTLYQDFSVGDERAAIEFCQVLAVETRAIGKAGMRIIVDYGDRFMRPWSRFVEHLTDPKWTTDDHFVNVLMLFDKNAVQAQQGGLDLLKSRLTVVDLSEATEAFSRRVGLAHSDISGRKILLEYDPTSDYDKVISSLLAESSSNLERVVVFTRKDSPVYASLEGRPEVKIFTLTSKVSYPRIEEENRVLLPAYDISLLLDALTKAIEAYGSALTIIFDSISHYVFTTGTDRTQSLVRQSLELMISSRITGLFLVNLNAHDPKVVSTFESLFDMEILCRRGDRLPEIRRRVSTTL